MSEPAENNAPHGAQPEKKVAATGETSPSGKGAPVDKSLAPQSTILRRIVLTVATGFGTGLSPFASGTVGTLVGVLLFWFLAPPYVGWLAYIVASAVLIVLAILVSTAAEAVYQKTDDGRVVIDEIVGYLVAMLWAPHTWQAVLTGFVLFRFFDIVKPPPARGLQSLRGGLGIVVDDLVAGAYACVILHLLRHISPVL